MIFSACFAIAQSQGFQRRTVEERVKDVNEKLAVLKLSAEQASKSDSVFTEFFTSSDKSIEEMRASGSFDREAMMTKRKELTDARDARLKVIFTAEQFKKFKDEIEPSMRPQRRPNGN